MDEILADPASALWPPPPCPATAARSAMRVMAAGKDLFHRQNALHLARPARRGQGRRGAHRPASTWSISASACMWNAPSTRATSCTTAPSGCIVRSSASARTGSTRRRGLPGFLKRPNTAASSVTSAATSSSSSCFTRARPMPSPPAGRRGQPGQLRHT